MAGNTRKRKPSNNKTNTRKKSSTSRNTSSHNKEFYNEIFLVIGITISLLILLSSFGLIGTLGDVINTVTFGTLGITAYIFPILLCLNVCILVANKGNSLAKRKMIYSFIFLCIISGMVQLFQYEDNTELTQLFNACAEKKQGGGWIGGLLTNVLYPLTKFWGTFIILCALLIIMIILISEKLIITSMASKSISKFKDLYSDIKNSEYDEADNYEEEYLTKAEYVKKRDKRKPATTFKFTDEDNNSDEAVNNEMPKKKQRKKKSKVGMEELNINNGTKSSVTTDEILSINSFQHNISNNSSIETSEYSIDKETGEIYEQELKRKFRKKNNIQHNDLSVNENIASNNEKISDKEDTSYSDTYQNRIIPEYLDDKTIRSSSDTHNNAIASNITKSVAKNTTVRSDDISEINNKNMSSDKNTKNKKEDSSEGQILLDSSYSNGDDLYKYPPLELLESSRNSSKNRNNNEQFETAQKLEDTLKSFGVNVTVTDISVGPTVTRYEMQPEQGVKVSKITNLADDIKLNLAATDIRIEAPIPGKAAVGIEVPNKEAVAVPFRELLESKEFQNSKANLAFAVGKDLAGEPIVTDIAKMPHLLIAGQTGSGKSVCINTLIMSILFKYHPDDVKLIMVDPKVVELSVYNGVPHLMIPVVTDAKKASMALNWAVAEMVDRYNKFAQLNVRNISGYNERVDSVDNSEEEGYTRMPQIVIIVDELADLMMVAPGEVEDAICRLAQMARAAGIHLVIATQRPSVNVITGLIKANVPSRIAFSVASAIDSRTILDIGGAEKLLGKGDMLFYPSGYPKPVRIQGAFVSDKEVNAVVEFLKNNNENAYSEEVIEKIENSTQQSVLAESKNNGVDNSNDQYFAEAGKFIIEKEKASIGMLQRVYKIGFNRAARIMDQLAQAGVVGPEEGTKPRKILMTMEEFEQYLNENAQ